MDADLIMAGTFAYSGKRGTTLGRFIDQRICPSTINHQPFVIVQDSCYIASSLGSSLLPKLEKFC